MEENVLQKKIGYNTERKEPFLNSDTEGNVLFVQNGKEEKQKKPGRTGVISAQMLKNIIADKDPSLFDEEEIKKRDENLYKKIKILNENDSQNNYIRKGKLVLLKPEETIVLFALFYWFGDPREQKDIQTLSGDLSAPRVVRMVNIRDLSYIIHNSARQREIGEIRKILMSLHSTFQFVRVNTEAGTVKIIAPLINIKFGILLDGNGNPEETTGDVLLIEFGNAFFANIDHRFTIITPRLFEVCRKAKLGELFITLLGSVMYAYPYFYTEAKKAEKKAYKEGGLIFRLKFSTIKNRIVRDYDSSKQKRYQFKKDLEAAANLIKEIGYIKRYTITPSEKGDGKISIVMNDEIYKQNQGRLLPWETISEEA